MKHTIYKWFWSWDFEKEEKWLNEMSAKGLQLVSVSFCRYVFEEGNLAEYSYRLELLENVPSNIESVSYIHFLEETGVDYVASVFRWAYFRKKVADGEFEIYSDIDSKINYYKRILRLFIGVTPVNIFGGLSNLSNYIENKEPVTLLLSSISLLVTFLLGIGIIKVFKEISKLKKEKLIRE